MGSKTDKIKGRLKEAVGALTDNDSLKREGQRDQVMGEMQGKVERAAAEMQEKVERVVEKMQDA